MSNMSHCRFENTAHDLEDCLMRINEGNLDEISATERTAMRSLIDLCRSIEEDHSDLLDTLDEIDERRYTN